MTSAPPPSNIGTHCSLPTCNALDFLPLTCAFCSSSFCSTHASPSSHHCAADPATKQLTEEEVRATEGQLRGPELRELLPDPKRHKREEVVLSEEERAKKQKQAEALGKLKATIASSKTGGSGGTSAAAAKKVNPAVELMKLKQRAKPADAKHVKREGDVAMADRVYLTVRFQEGEDGKEERGVKEVWVAKTISAGKALDLFADLFKVNNQNNTTSDPSKLLSLALPSASPAEPLTRLVLPSPLSLQITNGGSVLLLRGYPWSS